MQMWFHGQLAQKNLQWHLWMVSYTLHFIKRNSRVVLFLDSFVTFFSFHGFCTLTSNEPIACTRSKSIFKSCLLKQKKCHFWALVLKLWATSLSFELFLQSNHSPKQFVGKFNVEKNCLKDRKCHFWHWYSNYEWHLSPLNEGKLQPVRDIKKPTNSPIQSAAKCLWKPLKWKSKACFF